MTTNTDIQTDWKFLLNWLETTVGKRPADLNAVLFLIGVQELGKGPRRYTKEQKQDLLHIAVCKVMSLSGYYELEGYDKDGWPVWNLAKPLPYANLSEQESFLQQHVLNYFVKEADFTL